MVTLGQVKKILFGFFQWSGKAYVTGSRHEGCLSLWVCWSSVLLVTRSNHDNFDMIVHHVAWVTLELKIHQFCFGDAILLWLLTAACILSANLKLLTMQVEQRLSKDIWPEYYDGKLACYIGKEAQKFQTWSIASYLVAKMMLEDSSHFSTIGLEEDKKVKKPCLTWSASWTAWWIGRTSFSKNFFACTRAPIAT